MPKSSPSATPPLEALRTLSGPTTVDGAAEEEDIVQSRLEQLQAVIGDYFTDGQTIFGGGSTHKGADLRGFANHLRELPMAGYTPAVRPRDEQQRKVVAKRVAVAIMDVEQRMQDHHILQLDVGICICSTLSVLLMFVENVLAWIPKSAVSPPPVELTKTPTLIPGAAPPIPYVDPRTVPLADRLTSTSLLTVRTILYAIVVLSLVSMGLIIQLYRRILNDKRRKWCKVGAEEVVPRATAYEFWRSPLPILLFLELAVHVVCPYPFFSILDNPNVKYMELFMLLRLYTIARLAHHASPLYRSRRDILRANAELRLANFTVRFQDTMKLYFFNYTFRTGLGMYMIVALIGGFVVYVAERDANNGFDPAPNPPYTPSLGFNTLLDGIYFMMISIRTIGYGDLRPITVVGRFATVIFQFFGMAAESVLGSVVINKIAKTREEKLVDEHLRAFSAWHELRVASAMLIQATWKTSIGYRCRHGKVSKEREEAARRAFKRNKELRDAINNKGSADVDDGLSNGNRSNQRKKMRLRNDDTNFLNQHLGMQQIVQHMTSAAKERAQVKATELDPTRLDGGFDAQDLSAYMLSRSGERLLEFHKRMPYLKHHEERVALQDLVLRLSAVFNPEANISRWGRSRLEDIPSGFKATRKFDVTRKVIDRNGAVRRVPLREGHKADVRLQALQQFRAARQAFNQTVSSSSDHVVDRNLSIIFSLLVSASKKIKRNAILLEGLNRAAITETQSVDLSVELSLGGGQRGRPLHEML